jgi:hypothetical protein
MTQAPADPQPRRRLVLRNALIEPCEYSDTRLRALFDVVAGWIRLPSPQRGRGVWGMRGILMGWISPETQRWDEGLGAPSNARPLTPSPSPAFGARGIEVD